MTERTFATFDADIPDDTEWSSSDEVSVPGGRNVCDILVAVLTDNGFDVSMPRQRDSYGWELDASKGKGKIWLLLQYTGPWLLIAEDKSTSIGLLTHLSCFSETLVLLAEELARRSQFKNVRWYTKAEYEKERLRSEQKSSEL